MTEWVDVAFEHELQPGNRKVLTPPACEDVETFPVRIENNTVQVDIG